MSEFKLHMSSVTNTTISKHKYSDECNNSTD